MSIPAAKGIVAKDIRVTTLSGAAVTVMCDPTTVRSYSSSEHSRTLGARFADRAHPAIECIDLDRRRVRVFERSFPADRGRKMSMRGDCGLRLGGCYTIDGVG